MVWSGVKGLILGVIVAFPAGAETRHAYLEQVDGTRVEIAEIRFDGPTYEIVMADAVFSDHFLSMRPFKCLTNDQKHWCHLPYPYEIKRDISANLTDLEYDFLFVWKGATEYGINLWNGVYYQLTEVESGYVGTMHELNLDPLGVPPEAGELRPINRADMDPADPDSHWLPRLVIE
ncbi:MAG: hypothetical protein VX202_01120 [Pseudomonadota bacterium]|nr:hypothetical protein [Pseudomonadota bacterium]